ncbi:hypothetical protein CGG80_01510 [Vibrio parahaemolyticus]|uniref:hypothetical protein n=1 Tax=Vibrio parahaemolyticus TaxID=670 RepID=UPI00111C95CB|nr:hypothetical protein [Vibrio parahaemolyticus]HAS3591806.1 hypothetical protein [Vibrio cholerae]EGQ7855631.1 hypothetical protein [Vibrio parahaemolyticus]ELA7159652.1 hypothetical protein [Vibrio parahaemolyticus]ELJ8874181.1 hypothetical protein [Vibrio parahaemolyticus]MDF4867416.1 hypothetical protein [Vibrio parahaemolyticus]
MNFLKKMGLMPLILSVSISLELPTINFSLYYQSSTVVTEQVDTGNILKHKLKDTKVFFSVSDPEADKG